MLHAMQLPTESNMHFFVRQIGPLPIPVRCASSTIHYELWSHRDDYTPDSNFKQFTGYGLPLTG